MMQNKENASLLLTKGITLVSSNFHTKLQTKEKDGEMKVLSNLYYPS
jgi:hypothetical protein